MDLINSLHVNNDKSNGGKASMTMTEAYYYFAGQNPRSGNNKVKTDYTGNTAGSAASEAIYALPENALPQKAGTRAAGPPYNSPVIDGSCGQNFIIYISNGAAQDNNSDNHARLGNGLLLAEGGDTTTIPISPTGSMNQLADEWARFMEVEPVRHHHLHGRRQQGHHRPGAGLDGVAQEHGRTSAGASTSTSAPAAPALQILDGTADHLLRDPGSQHRVLLGQLAGQREHRGHLPQPDLYRHVPPGYGCVPALDG